MNGSRLTSVLRIRTIQERRARGELAASRLRLRRAELAERKTWTDLDERALGAVVSALSLQGESQLVAAGMRAAATQHDVTVQAVDGVAVAMDEWAIAARRVEGLERLAERVGAAERDEAARLAANEIDDLVLARYTGPEA